MTKKRRIITLGILALIIILGGFYYMYGETHTFSLTDESATDSYLKSEQIQPAFGTVKVWGMGHSDITTTLDIYTDATSDFKKKEMLSFEEFINKKDTED